MAAEDQHFTPGNAVRIHVLGAPRISSTTSAEPRLSKSVKRLIALIAAAGPAGIGRDQMALELWGQPPPESWKSAIRNRMAAARKLLGADTILNLSGRFHFADAVTVDSWELVGHSLENLVDPDDELGFLNGEPFLDIETSPLIASHSAQVTDARSALLREIVAGSSGPMPNLSLQTLRGYQRRHPLNPTVTQETVRAHAQAGATNQATQIIEEVKALTKGAKRRTHPWVDQLETIIETGPPRRRKDDHPAATAASEEEVEANIRAELFATAANNEEWSVALEIAMAGLPEAARIGGDPARLKLLEAIPLDKLDPARKFSYCVALTRHLMYAGREEEASQWSRSTRALATTPDEVLLAYITASIVGDSPDERTPITLPTAFDSGSDETVNMQSLQVAVMSHLERASFEEAAPLRYRFNALVEASADPYRRWHMLLLEAMTHFVDGDFTAANETATRAFRYADLFSVVDAEMALLAHTSNGHWVHAGFPSVADPAVEYPASAQSTVGVALQAAAFAHEDGGERVHEFLRSINWMSRSFFTFPNLMIVAGHITDSDLRARVSARLKKRSGTSAIWGTGVLHLGPVDRALAQLADNPLDRELHLTAAMHVADRQRTRLWQVVCRLDLAIATGNEEHRRRAQPLATTPVLEQLLREYPGI